MPDLFGDDEQPAERDHGEDNRCTPELLLDFVRQHLAATGQYPSLAVVKARFGGLLGPLVDGWLLKRQGRWPKLKK